MTAVFGESMIGGKDYSPVLWGITEYCFQLTIEFLHSLLVFGGFKAVNVSSVIGSSQMADHEMVFTRLKPFIDNGQCFIICLTYVLKSIICRCTMRKHGIRIQIVPNVKSREGNRIAAKCSVIEWIVLDFVGHFPISNGIQWRSVTSRGHLFDTGTC